MKAITITQHSAEQTYGNGKIADGHHLLASNTTNSDSAQSANSLIDGMWFMFYRAIFLAAASVAVAGVFSGAAFGQSIEGVVRSPDGKALRDAEIRVEQKGNQSAVTTKTDSRGHYYYSRLSPGVYTVSVVLDGALKSSVNVKTAANNSRIDFDLKPAAAKKVKHYVWVDAKTGTHMGSGWVEVDDAGNAAPGALNSQTSSGELAREILRRSTNPKEHP
ncbi:MAG: hypothetical protein DMF73_12925 [Acidobacteria bacterium]|nr:MAG: hypothetical protein DMF73_12925 [Acidobacteriota bacterium]